LGTMIVGVPNSASFTLAGGSLASGQLWLGAGPGDQGQGTFAQSGGIHVNTNQILVNGHSPAESATFLGHYLLSGGQLQTPALNINGGEFVQSGATATAGTLKLIAQGRGILDAGVLQFNKGEIYGDYPWLPGTEATLTQRGGANSSTSSLTLARGGIY